MLSSLTEDQHDALRRVAPLLVAAKALLQWQLDDPDCTFEISPPDERGLAAAGATVGAALRSALRLQLQDPATANQVRSLLRDCASYLRAAMQDSALGQNL